MNDIKITDDPLETPLFNKNLSLEARIILEAYSQYQAETDEELKTLANRLGFPFELVKNTIDTYNSTINMVSIDSIF